MNEIHSRPLVVGIDAGGTRTRAYLAEAEGDADGRVLGTGAGGPGNALSVDRSALTRHLADAIRAAVPEGRRTDVVAVVGGFAGAANGAGPEAGRDLARSCLRAALDGHGIRTPRIAVCGDLEVAFASAPGTPPDGLVLIAGTGAVAARVEKHRKTVTADGYGWLLGDDGSGFWLGREVALAVLRALDGRGSWTSLVEAVAAHYLGNPGGPYLATQRPGRHDREVLRARIIPRVYADTPLAMARLSPLAVTAEEDGDEVATALLDAAADELAATVEALEPREGEPLVAAGGLLGPHGPLLGRVTARAETMGLRVLPVRDGGAGALALARLRLRGIDVD
ncbi:BadF/BadG/BcrA/BcrD ATPase family protein [Streptomyces sp. H10-C2]|uniref:N-acetylglucosamine kinase n=1 Tax=unclassified Streptomyces TaxID=2593676 RepID=UPI0024B9BD98|nr:MULTISPECIES: BadF/BadG/BcrA/BcrD ATPase family protein [unclassified Streptomyces]MDJ0345440.1 BadF/BadG/BcrA/BcrD ATPase family protein [Streptomyces sp. PH10-H1]MDJ0374296.1 BadF/BadG/BcrA/BcrD ATPase family protein [Streptomyces sp. H10-C2]